MFFLMLRQTFLREKKRKSLAVATVFLAASLITALLNLSIDIGDQMTQELKSYGANLTVLPQSENIPLEIGGVDYNPLKGQVFLQEKDLPSIKDIFWRHNIAGFVPYLKTVVQLADPAHSTESAHPIPLTGTFFDKHLPVPEEASYRTGARLIYPYWYVTGQWPKDNQPDQALAGEHLATRMGWKAGDTVQVQTRPNTPDTPETTGKQTGKQTGPQAYTFTITGILSTGGAQDNALIAPLATVQKLTGLQGKIQSIEVSALTVPEDALARRAQRDPDSLDARDYDIWYCTAYVSSIAYQLEEAIPGATANPIWQVAASEGVIIKKIQLLMAVVTLAAFIASGLGISSLMTTAIMERSREIGLMKALGASNTAVYLLFLSEAGIVGLVGGLLGWLAGTGLSQIIGLSVFDSLVSISPIVIPVILFVSILISLAGSLVPSRLIARLYPAEVLHGRK